MAPRGAGSGLAPPKGLPSKPPRERSETGAGPGLCPSAGRDTYSGTYAMDSKPDAYTFFCQGPNHLAARVPGNYPQYTSTEGLLEK